MWYIETSLIWNLISLFVNYTISQTVYPLIKWYLFQWKSQYAACLPTQWVGVAVKIPSPPLYQILNASQQHLHQQHSQQQKSSIKNIATGWLFSRLWFLDAQASLAPTHVSPYKSVTLFFTFWVIFFLHIQCHPCSSLNFFIIFAQSH